MEKLVFKNMYLNIVIGAILLIASILGYFMGWIEDYLPVIVAVILVLLSAKRFFFTFKKITSKNATLILVIEFILDLAFAALLIALQDHIGLFIGLIIYIRGVAYLLINYIATRKINLVQYIINIGYVTFGSFMMFTTLDTDTFFIIFVAALVLLVGAIYLQAGLQALAKKEKEEEAKEKAEDHRIKEQKKEFKEQEKEQKQKEHSKIEQQKDKIEDLEEEVKQVKQELKQQEKVVKEQKKEPPKVNLDDKTVVELKALAKERGLQGYSALTKAELIALLKQ